MPRTIAKSKRPARVATKPARVKRSDRPKGFIRYPTYKSQYLGPALSALGTAGGTALGGMILPSAPASAAIGGGVGGVLGHLIGQGIGKVTGFGEYRVRSNVLYSGAQVPMIRNRHKGRNATIIRHREYVCDVISSSTAGAFQVQSFPINPGLAQTFEFLSQIACNYTEYKIEGLLFDFKTTSVDALNSTNTALGTVYMATQYDSLSPDFSSKAEMASYEFCTMGKPSQDVIHPVECDPHQNPISELYIRTGGQPSNSDLRMYDLGRFQIATVGMQASSVNVGELHCTYQVALYKPRLYASLGNFNDCMIAGILDTAGQSISPTNIFSNSLGVTTQEFPSQWVVNINNFPKSFLDSYNYGTFPITNPSTSVLWFHAPQYPMGVRIHYSIQWLWSATKPQSVTAPVISTVGACTSVNYFIGGYFSGPRTGESATVWTLDVVFDFAYSSTSTAPKGIVTYNNFPTDANAFCKVAITMIPNIS